jgi:hypothetical protein
MTSPIRGNELVPRGLGLVFHMFVGGVGGRGASGRFEHMFDTDHAHPTPDGDTSPEAAPPTADADGDDVVARVVAAVDALAGDDPTGLGWAGQRERLRAVGRLVDRLEAQQIQLLEAADRSGALTDRATTAASWLRRHSSLTASQASGRARLACRLVELPVIAAAYEAMR